MNAIFDDLLQSFREQAKIKGAERYKGNCFEVFCVKLLKAWDRFSNFEKVDLWSNWDSNEGDCGIDIVAKTENNEYVAIQCKCYDDNAKLDLKDLSTFFASANRTFMLNGEKVSFTQLILMDTAKDLTDKAQKTLETQEKPTSRIDYTQIEDANIDWEQLTKKQEIVFNPKKKLRTHQTEAIEAIKKEFIDHDRAKLIMACGTGKSLTSIRLFDEMLENGNVGIFFAPSIALVAQTLKESFEQSEKEFRAFVVCSDTKVGAKSDDEDIKSYELPIPPTTNADRLAHFIEQDLNKNERVIIFSTYQSIDVIIEAQKILNNSS